MKVSPKDRKQANLEGTLKLCTLCRKEQDISEFYSAQARCKSCANMYKSMDRCAVAQGWTDWQSKKQDEKFVADLMKEFKKEQSKPRKNGQKIRFNFHEYFQNYVARDSVKKVNLFSMLTEEDYLDFAQTKKGGSLTAEEARKEWKKMEEDSAHPKDQDGPRGMLRSKVKVDTIIEESEEVARERGMRSSAKMSKDSTVQDLASRFSAAVVGNAGTESHDYVGWSNLSKAASSAMGRSSDVLSGEGLMATDLSHMAESL
eukprot:1983508-Amphidinium_carterae.1